MRDQTTHGLQMTWVQVRDEQGRTHLEARWASAAPAAVSTAVPVAKPHAA